MTIYEQSEIFEFSTAFALGILVVLVLNLIVYLLFSENRGVQILAISIAVLSLVALSTDIGKVPTGRLRYAAVVTDGSEVDLAYLNQLRHQYYNVKEVGQNLLSFEDMPNIDEGSDHYLAKLWVNLYGIHPGLAMNWGDAIQKTALQLLCLVAAPAAGISIIASITQEYDSKRVFLKCSRIPVAVISIMLPLVIFGPPFFLQSP